MKINIDLLSEDELMELNHKIVERLKFLESMHTRSSTAESLSASNHRAASGRSAR